MSNKNITYLLISPCCKKSLKKNRDAFICFACKKKYPADNNKIILMLDTSVKKFSYLFTEVKKTVFPFENWKLIKLLIAPSESLRIVNKEKELLKSIQTEDMVLSIGSTKDEITNKQVLHMDVNPNMNVDIVADASHLPFKNSAFTLVICRFVLEHVEDPITVVSEIYRVLKPGGIIYIDMPFLNPMHNSPADYSRLTVIGLKKLMINFKEIETGISMGPASALAWVIREFPGMFIENKILFRASKFIMGWLVFPIKYLDYFLVKRKNAAILASSFYFIGEKD